jgi:hypothetical protein
LTLSPALTALLLRPRSKGTPPPPLPWVAFPLIGGTVAWFLLDHLLPSLKVALALLPDGFAKPLSSHVEMTAVVIGAVAIGLLANPLNRLLGIGLTARFIVVPACTSRV